MALSSKKNHEIVIQILYSFEMGCSEEEEIIPLIMDELKLTHKEILEGLACAKKVWKNVPACDEMIGKLSTAYEFKRIGVVEKSILRFALFQKVFEALDEKEMLAEALRLTKKFCGASASSFVHALLEKAYVSSVPPC